MTKFFALSLAALSTLATVSMVRTDARAQSVLVDYRDRRDALRDELDRLRDELRDREFDALLRHQARLDALRQAAASDRLITPQEARELERAQALQSRRLEAQRDEADNPRGPRRLRR